MRRTQSQFHTLILSTRNLFCFQMLTTNVQFHAWLMVSCGSWYPTSDGLWTIKTLINITISSEASLAIFSQYLAKKTQITQMLFSSWAPKLQLKFRHAQEIKSYFPLDLYLLLSLLLAPVILLFFSFFSFAGRPILGLISLISVGKGLGTRAVVTHRQSGMSLRFQVAG